MQSSSSAIVLAVLALLLVATFHTEAAVTKAKVKKDAAVAATAAATPSATKEEPPIASVTNASPSHIYLHMAVKEYVTLPRRFAMARKECEPLIASMNFPPVLSTFALMYHPDGNKLPEMHKQAHDASKKQAETLKCTQEHQVLWQNAEILLGAIVNAFHDVQKEAAAINEQNAQAAAAEEKKTTTTTVNKAVEIEVDEEITAEDASE